jgi:hypothetical protein
MGNEQTRVMRQKFEQTNYINLKPSFRIPFPESKVIKIDEQICLVHNLNTLDYKQTFIQVDNFLKKMNRKCPEIASFLFISESHDQNNIFFLVFEFATQQVSNIEFSLNFTKIVNTIIKALIFMEKIQLFYPHISLENILKIKSPNGSFTYKLINQFCFKETFRFVVEYLLNVKISEKKQIQILDDMKNKSLSQLCTIISEFIRNFPSLCNSSGKMSNVSIFLNKLNSMKNTVFTFKDVLNEFENLFDLNQNRNKYFQTPIQNHIRTTNKISSNDFIKKNSKKLNIISTNRASTNGLVYNTRNDVLKNKRIKLVNQIQSKPISVKEPSLNHSIKSMNTTSYADAKDFPSISRLKINQNFKKYTRKGSKKYVIHHRKGSSGFYSMNDNRLDDLSTGVRFSENVERDIIPRTTLQRNFIKASDVSKGNVSDNAFKKKTKTSYNFFMGKNENTKLKEKKDSITVNDRFVKKNSLPQKVETVDIESNTPILRISKRNNRYTNRSTLMSQVQEEYNFTDNTMSPMKDTQERSSVSNPPNKKRHFSFTKDYTIAIDPQQKEQIRKYISKSPKEVKPPSPENNVFTTHRTARMSENIFGSSTLKLNDNTSPNKFNKNSSKAIQGPGLRRSSSITLIKKENEELKKKQMKKSIYNLNRREKNDGVKQYGEVQSKTFKLKTHKREILNDPENEYAPIYLDFGDCPGYCYRVTVVKSDNNALADKRFYNNPRNFYPPKMLINLNSCNRDINSNVSGQLIKGLKTSQMNYLTRLRMNSQYFDFESLVNFDNNLKSSVYHNLDELEEEFDLSDPPVIEKKPSAPMILGSEKVEQIDSVTFKMQGIEFKDLRGQKNVDIENLKKKLNDELLLKSKKVYGTHNHGRVVKRNTPMTGQVRRVKPNRQLKSVDLRTKYKTQPNANSNRTNEYSNINNTSINFYPSEKSDYRLPNRSKTNTSLMNQIGNRIMKKHQIGVNIGNSTRKYYTNEVYPSSNIIKNYSTNFSNNGRKSHQI